MTGDWTHIDLIPYQRDVELIIRDDDTVALAQTRDGAPEYTDVIVIARRNIPRLIAGLRAAHEQGGE